jgi:hypothetical protein|tara:strand:- start:4181 stop:4909 length:729 start_codon:yes stop_codon:yes gene_type:complete
MVTFSDWVDYLECSYRGRFSDRQPTLNVHHAKVVALAEATKFSLMRKAEGKTISLDHLKAQLSKAWQTVRGQNHFDYSWKDLVSTQEQMVRIDDLVSDKDAVIAVNFPIQIRPSKDFVDGAIDAIILKNQDCPTKEYLQILLFDYTAFASRTNKSPLLKFIAGFYDLALRADRISTIKRKYSFLKLSNGKIQDITVEPFDENQVLSVVRCLERGIGTKVWLPTSNPGTCRDCMYNQGCTWRQ